MIDVADYTDNSHGFYDGALVGHKMNMKYAAGTDAEGVSTWTVVGELWVPVDL